MENPLKELRLKRRWSLEQMAGSSGLSKQLIIRAEQGCYNDPPPRLLEFLLNRFDSSELDESELLLKYKAFQKWNRQRNYGILPVGLLKVPADANPMRYYRSMNKLSQAQVYKSLCIHPTIMHKLEKQPHLCNTLPGQFLTAVYESGYTMSWAAHLSYLFDEHKKYLQDRVEVTVT